jgi:hypothetical protein
MGDRRVLTVEEGCRVDACARFGLGKIPHLVKRPALGNGDHETDEEENGVQDDSCTAEDPESPC